MSTETKFSKAELKMFEALGRSCMCSAEALGPLMAYTMAASEVFTEDEKGPEVEALRRACRALSNGQPYRLTPEFDELLAF